MKGMLIKQIAKCLDLSPRSVEHYLDDKVSYYIKSTPSSDVKIYQLS